MSDSIPKQKRTIFSQKLAIISQIIDLLAENKTQRQIIKILCAQTGKGREQMHRYYQAALLELQTCKSIKTADARNVKIESLTKDLNEAYANYLEHKSPRWFEIYIQIKQHLDKYYPNELKPESETPDLNITIKYDKA